MFLDIGIGILLSYFVGTVFHLEPSLGLFSLGIFFALLPDIDILLMLLPSKSRINSILGGHRGIIHRPLLYILLAPCILLFFGKIVAVLFVLGVAWHLLHDTLVLGWGIKWVWPFSQRSFKFFPDKDGKITNVFLLSWLPEEEEAIKKRYHSSHWIKSFYCTVNPISLIEYGVFIVSVFLLVNTFLK